jgi:hypothetical protein
MMKLKKNQLKKELELTPVNLLIQLIKSWDQHNYIENKSKQIM